MGRLFCELGTVPGEVGALGDGAAVGAEAEFGDAATEGVVGVVPAGAVRGGDVGEAVVGVPGVVPGVGFPGEAGDLAQGGASGGVVLVADAARGGELGAGVGTWALGRPGGRGARPVGVGEVACRVVGVALGPGGRVDGGDAADRVEVEAAGAGELVGDGGEVAVGAVAVVAALQDVPAGADGTGRSGGAALSQVLVRVRLSPMVRVCSWPAASWVKSRVPPEVVSRTGEPCGVVGPGAGVTGGGGAADPAAQDVPVVGQGATVDGLGEQVAEGVEGADEVGTGVGGPQQAAGRVVGVGGDAAVGVLAVMRPRSS